MSLNYEFLVNLCVPIKTKSVMVTGTFDNWKCNTQMLKRVEEANFHIYSLSIPICKAKGSEKFLFKFIVDGIWLCSQDYETEWDDAGNENNVFYYNENMDCIHLQQIPKCKVNNWDAIKTFLLNKLKLYQDSKDTDTLVDSIVSNASLVSDFIPPPAPSSSSFWLPHSKSILNPNQQKKNRSYCFFTSIFKHFFLRFAHLS